MEAASLGAWIGNGATATRDTTQFHGGAASLVATARTATWQGVAQSLLPAVTAGALSSGDILYVTAWARVSTASDTVSISSDLGVSGTGVTGHAYTVTNTAWTQISQLVPVVWATTPTTIKLFFQGPASGTDLYLDDVTVTKVPNIITNGGFENGTTGWTGNGGTLTASTTTPFAGTATASVTNRVDEWNGTLQSLTSSVVSGARVAMTAWVRVTPVVAATALPASPSDRISGNLTLSGGSLAATNYFEIVNKTITATDLGVWVPLLTTWDERVLPTWTTAPTGADFYIKGLVGGTAWNIEVDSVTVGLIAP